MAFLITGGYIAVLFGVGVWFVYKERQIGSAEPGMPQQNSEETVYTGIENRHMERRRRAFSGIR